MGIIKKIINLEKTAENGQTSESREEKKIFKMFPGMLPTNSFVDQKSYNKSQIFFSIEKSVNIFLDPTLGLDK